MASIRTEVDSRVLSLSNLDKVLYPATGFTKAEVIEYYAQIAPTMLTHVSDRAMTRVRFPDGVGESAIRFYEKNAPKGAPDWVRTQRVLSSDGPVDYVVADDTATLVWLANLAALEMHVPQWRIGSATPDSDGAISLGSAEPSAGEPMATTVVVDLDPGPGITLLDSARAALLIAAILADDGLLPTPRSTGSKGLQLYCPVQPTRPRLATQYVRDVAKRAVAAHPDLFVDSVAKSVRNGRIFVDYNQNLPGRNTVAPYSLRGRDRPGVATPLSWEELGAADHPDQLRFSPNQVLHRVDDLGDLAADCLTGPHPPLPTNRALG